MLPCHLYIILSELSVHLLFSNWIFYILLLTFESYILDTSLLLDTQLANNFSQFTVCLFILVIETFTEKRIDFSFFLLWTVILMSSVRTHCLALEPNPGFPRWHSGKESACQFRRHKGHLTIPATQGCRQEITINPILQVQKHVPSCLILASSFSYVCKQCFSC